MSQKSDNQSDNQFVSFSLPELPDLSEERQAELRAIAAQPDRTIGTSDIPEMTEEQWRTATRRDLYRPVKRQITARVDADVLAWLKSKGRGYQTRVNAILRREMLAELQGKPS